MDMPDYLADIDDAANYDSLAERFAKRALFKPSLQDIYSVYVKASFDSFNTYLAIEYDPEAFYRRIRSFAYAQAMECIDMPETD